MAHNANPSLSAIEPVATRDCGLCPLSLYGLALSAAWLFLPVPLRCLFIALEIVLNVCYIIRMSGEFGLVPWLLIKGVKHDKGGNDDGGRKQKT